MLRIHILDCYSDPLGWKDKLFWHESANRSSDENSVTVSIFRDVKDVDKLFCTVAKLGKGTSLLLTVLWIIFLSFPSKCCFLCYNALFILILENYVSWAAFHSCRIAWTTKRPLLGCHRFGNPTRQCICWYLANASLLWKMQIEYLLY